MAHIFTKILGRLIIPPSFRCEVVLFITETGPSGVKKRISANETYNFFNQPSIKQQLLTILMVEQLVLKVDLSADKMREYLAVPQAGMIFEHISHFSLYLAGLLQELTCYCGSRLLLIILTRRDWCLTQF